jgi:hypothetical protein
VGFEDSSSSKILLAVEGCGLLGWPECLDAISKEVSIWKGEHSITQFPSRMRVILVATDWGVKNAGIELQILIDWEKTHCARSGYTYINNFLV